VAIQNNAGRLALDCGASLAMTAASIYCAMRWKRREAH
jgi:hypothetical protein